ncbi:hypothetical protein N2152v2_001083 [Parachlorella kessleri]
MDPYKGTPLERHDFSFDLPSGYPEASVARPHDGEPPSEFAELRNKCPVATAKLFDDSDIWLITKHEDLKKVLTDNRLSKVRTHPGFPELAPGAKAAIQGREATFVDMDPPQHTKLRSMFAPWFTQEHSEKLRPSIRQKVDELIDGLESSGSKLVDLQENFSLPFAFKVIFDLLGIPFKDYKMLSNNIAVRASASGTARQAAAAQEELTRYMHDLVAQKERNPQDDVLSGVVKKYLRSGDITRDQLVAHAFLLLVAGNATVAGMINLGVVTLLQHPDQLEALKADPGLWPGAVHELCRYHTASSFALRRVALEDVKVGDRTIQAGEGLIALNQSANRDEDVFPDPDRFDIRRSPNPHIAYGYGAHECVAMALALVELEEALAGLFRRLPGLQLGVAPGELDWSKPTGDVGLVKLLVTW